MENKNTQLMNESLTKTSHQFNRVYIPILKEFYTLQVNRLEPVVSLNSKIGYDYPLVQKFTQEGDQDDDITLLEILAHQSYLRRHFFDRVYLCHKCHQANLNTRESCSSCRSLYLRPVNMLHHFRCAHVAKEEDFFHEEHLVCPKCKRDLKHIGVDYDRTGEHFFCVPCQKIDVNPELVSQCRHCLEQFNFKESSAKTIYSYSLTPRGEKAAQNLDLEPTPFQYIDATTGLYATDFFDLKLKHEIERAKHFKRVFSLLAIQLHTKNNKLKDDEEFVIDDDFLEAIVAISKKFLSPVDLSTRYSEKLLLTFLTETDSIQARNLVQKFQQEIRQIQPPEMECKVISASYPEDMTDDASVQKFIAKAAL